MINVITATTFVVQVVGPLMVKQAITRAGEVGLATPAEAEGSMSSVPCMEPACAEA